MTRAARLGLTLLVALGAARADALCIYHGTFGAFTTVGQEFADSRWVVRARLVSARDGMLRSGPDAGARWTRYRLQLVRAYKGHPPLSFSTITARNSGGFYLDRPWLPLPAAHDIGSTYLLFLNPVADGPDTPAAARGSTHVNYNCGQSGPWREVPRSARRALEALAR